MDFSKALRISALLFVFIFPMSSEAFDLLVNGFGTVTASRSDMNNHTFVDVPVFPLARTTSNAPLAPLKSSAFVRPRYMEAERRWNFLSNSKLALQFTALLDHRFKAVCQLVGRGESMVSDHYTTRMDWAYLQYNANNNLDVQLGRFRVPAFYFSDFLDVNNAQPWVRPPEEVYFIVGSAFRNMDGIKARYTAYVKDWTLNSQFWFGSMQDTIFILFNEIDVKVRDVFGVAALVSNDTFSFRGSLMRAVYDTNLFSTSSSPVPSLVRFTNVFGGSTSAEANNLLASPSASDKNQSIIYVGLAAGVDLSEKLNLLFERASILSPGIISTARVGWYGSATYSVNDKLALTGTMGYTRPLKTEVTKYNLVRDFVNTSQYATVDANTGAGAALAEGYRSYLGRQHSYGLDLRYDILPALAFKAGVKCIHPSGGAKPSYIFTRQLVDRDIWVYKLSMDFVF